MKAALMIVLRLLGGGGIAAGEATGEGAGVGEPLGLLLAITQA